MGSREENSHTEVTATTLAMTPPSAAWVSSRVLRRSRGMPRASTSVKAMLPMPLVTPMPTATPRKVRLTAAARSGSSRLIVDRAKRKPADAVAVRAMTVRLRRRVARTLGAQDVADERAHRAERDEEPRDDQRTAQRRAEERQHDVGARQLAGQPVAAPLHQEQDEVAARRFGRRRAVRRMRVRCCTGHDRRLGRRHRQRVRERRWRTLLPVPHGSGQWGEDVQAQVRPQRLGDDDRAVRLLVVLEDRHQPAGRGEGAVQRRDGTGSPAPCGSRSRTPSRRAW